MWRGNAVGAWDFFLGKIMWFFLTILVHGHQVATGLEMDAQLKEDELT